MMQIISPVVCSVDVCINGNPVKKYGYEGKTFVAAAKGNTYTIKIRNNSYGRILAVVSIDGINALDGGVAGASKAGYVINGYNSFEVKGFRTSNDSVNAFKFADKEKSYAAKTEASDPSNCGVIGVEIYSEKISVSYAPPSLQSIINSQSWLNYPFYNNRGNYSYREYEITCLAGNIPRGLDSSSNSTLKCSNSNEASYGTSCCDFDVGTEFSKEQITDKVVDTEFKIDKLENTFEIYYASKEALIKMGVPITKETGINFPTAFPGRFCKPPPEEAVFSNNIDKFTIRSNDGSNLVITTQKEINKK